MTLEEFHQLVICITPIRWAQDGGGLWGNGLYTYQVRPRKDGFYSYRESGASTTYFPDEPGIEAACLAAQEHYTHQVMSKLATKTDILLKAFEILLTATETAATTETYEGLRARKLLEKILLLDAETKLFTRSTM